MISCVRVRAQIIGATCFAAGLRIAPSAGPRRAKTVLGNRGIGITGIDVKTLPGNKVGIIGGQKKRRTDKILRLS